MAFPRYWASLVFVYNKTKPDEFFLMVNGPRHPIVHARKKLCLLGGHRRRAGGQDDKSPRDTLVREIRKKLSLRRGAQETSVSSISDTGPNTWQSPVALNEEPTREDHEKLEKAVQTILDNAEFCQACSIAVPKSMLDAADPKNNKGGFLSCVVFYTVGLDIQAWNDLRQLQEKFGNLATDAGTVIASLNRMRTEKQFLAFGHDNAVKRFLISIGITSAKYMPWVYGATLRTLNIHVEPESWTSLEKLNW